ncbi:lecithin retinol acyltransferase family protein [Synechococcus sp. HJ21-Hayes]|jgi:hypothetical protein|uniref:lecithin retinol acyltransferase family protein n=1 Tax=unclassified Synechococcus TaxID=2626047 RepID=UPI0020CD9D08|nr:MULTISPECIES: lecithin retinol acyltransferase family protein [unclassified Synechococcus]MCP9832037.1 lecithin retinol acyltransferase family protein [Synechococcus sp. JJ3a-Johnson]MCP9852748.1 lecithin retinol acyltransferase family protein [Synechococcus sp. HJ21-Hayes]
MAAADHLQVPRQHGLFNHHGIDLGDGSVAHYLEGREILRSSTSDFSRGEPVSVVTYAEPCSAPGLTLRRAMGRLGEQNYNLLFNNCEHFAHWCKTGRHRSAQVEGWLHTGSLGALALGQFVPAAVLTGARLLLRKGINLDGQHLEQGKALARKSLKQLDGLRLQLQEKLEQALAKAEARWGDDQFEALRLAAQAIADQLSEVEDMELKLERLLAESRGQ